MSFVSFALRCHGLCEPVLPPRAMSELLNPAPWSVPYHRATRCVITTELLLSPQPTAVLQLLISMVSSGSATTRQALPTAVSRCYWEWGGKKIR